MLLCGKGAVGYKRLLHPTVRFLTISPPCGRFETSSLCLPTRFTRTFQLAPMTVGHLVLH